jgi:hypothetical protein
MRDAQCAPEAATDLARLHIDNLAEPLKVSASEMSHLDNSQDVIKAIDLRCVARQLGVTTIWRIWCAFAPSP